MQVHPDKLQILIISELRRIPFLPLFYLDLAFLVAGELSGTSFLLMETPLCPSTSITPRIESVDFPTNSHWHRWDYSGQISLDLALLVAGELSGSSIISMETPLCSATTSITSSLESVDFPSNLSWDR